jgi:hypothetical protein
MIAIKQVCSENNIKKFVWGKTIWRNLQVQYVRGGVARNVAESMAQLGTCPLLISVVGEDFAGWLFRFQLLSFFCCCCKDPPHLLSQLKLTMYVCIFNLHVQGILCSAIGNHLGFQ